MAEVKRAVIVGVNRYREQTIPVLRGAEKDAEEVKDLLVREGQFQVEDPHFLVGEKATGDAIRGALSDLLWSPGRADVALFYFSGHGFQDSYGNGYVAPVDMEKQRPLVHGIEMRRLRELALRAPNRKAVVVILDCCYAGIASDGKGDPEALNAPEQCFSGMAEVEEERKEVAEGVYVFSSSSSDETSRELPGCQHKLGDEGNHDHGVFSFHLLEGLMGLAEHEGKISVEALRDHVAEALKGNASQTFRLFSSNEANAKDIILTRPTKMGALTRNLDGIRAGVDSGNYGTLIVAARNLGRLRRELPNYQAARDLEDRLKADLARCKLAILQWLARNTEEIFTSGVRDISKSLDALVVDLTLERLAAEKDQKLTGLLLRLAEAAQENKDFDALLPHLKACCAPLQAPPTFRANLGLGAPK